MNRCGVLLLAGMLLFGASGLAACGRSSSGGGSRSSVFTVGKENCSKQEVRVILTQFQKDYASFYGVDIWSNEGVDKSELAAYIRNCAVSELAWVYALDAAAAGMGIAPTEEEEELARTASREFLDSLDEATEKYLDIGESELQELFERYLTAKKTYENIVANVSTEVSDEEALVMDLQEICVSDAALASTLLTRIQNGEDFTALAQTYSENDEIDAYVSRTMYDDSVTERLFSLTDGEYTDVIEIDGRYYLFCCENYFDEARTEQNKENVLEARKETAVKEVCDSFADPADSVLRGGVLSGIEVDTTLDLSAPSFREVFEEYF